MDEKKKIAVVDDHGLVRKGICALINLFPNYEVIFDAANGEEFISKLRDHTVPDIVLLDIAMPVMDGYATGRWIMENHSNIRIIALSTMESESAIIKMVRGGAKGYVLKDAEPAELKQALDNVTTIGYFYNEQISRKLLRSVSLLADEHSEIAIFSSLSDRELQFLKLTCSDKTYAEIAKELFVSERTVDGYRDALFRKLDINTRVGLALFAVKNGIVVL